MAKNKIVQLQTTSSELSEEPIENEIKLLKLSPQNKCSKNYYENKSLGLYVGIQASNNSVNITTSHASDEFVTIVEGTVSIKNNINGKAETANKGESFVIPKGYDYQWQQSTDLITFQLTYQAPIESLSRSEKYENVFFIDEKNETPWQNTSDGYKKKVEYQSQNKNFTAGVWQGGHFKTGLIAFPYNEFILVKSGCLICTDTQESKIVVNIGEALFVPQGANCSWESQGEISLHFVQVKAD